MLFSRSVQDQSETYEIEFEECLVNGIRSYKCSICSESFNNKQLLADHHYSTHVSKTTKNDSVAKDFVIKDVIFVNSENQVLDENLRLFVYKCRLCTTAVAESNDMNNHINSDHNGEEFIIIDDEVVNIYFSPSKLYGSSKARLLAKNQL